MNDRISCSVTGAIRGRTDFAEQAFDLIFLRIAHAAMGHHTSGAGVEGGAGGEKFRGVGFSATGLFGVV